MAPDEIGERRQVNHTPTIALTIAAVLLLIVGALSYRDFVRSSLEKEYAEKERQLLIRHGYQVPVIQGQAGLANQQLYTADGVAVQPGTYQPAPQNVAPQPAPTQSTQNQQIAQNIAANQANVANQAASRRIESSLPQPVDPEINAFQTSLDQVRQQTQRTEQQYSELAGEVEDRVRAATAAEEPITSELPAFLREAVANPPGGNPSIEAELAQRRKKVSSAPALAQVTGYDKDWGIVTFNAGAGQGVEKGKRFAVRRGSDILGWVKVDEVQPNQSIAVLVTNDQDIETNDQDIDTAAKPAVGDDLINFELF